MIPKGILLFLCLLLFGIAHTQNRLSGLILNMVDEKVDGANVILKRKQVILTFTTSDKNGAFSLEWPGNLDSLILEITHLAYDTEQVPVKPDKAPYAIKLRPRSYKLPEVSVEVPPVVRKGDTLLFNVEAYKREGDENIEQVLKRIPGITVSSDGAIYYKGLDISRFYVEGLDMMEGRYRIITRNLGLHHIRDIEVIEHHQHVRALDSINRPENAAINLRLKSNVAITGNVRAEAALPVNGLVDVNMFGFTKAYQFNVSGSFNSIGENVGANFQRFYPTLFPIERELLTIKQVNNPFLLNATKTYLDNREFTGGLNYLRKLGEFTEIKLQGFTNIDRVNRVGSNLSTFFLGNETSAFTEELDAIEEPFELEGKAIVEYNGKKVFARINTELKSISNQSAAENIVNALSTEEVLEKNALDLNSNMNFILSNKRKAYQLKADIRYLEKDYRLDIMDAYLVAPDSGQQFFPELSQLASTKTFDARLYTNFYIKKGHLEGVIEIGPKLSRKSIDSRTLDQWNENDGELIGLDFQNDHTTTRQSIDLDQSWTYEKRKTKIRLSVPFSYNQFFINNELTASKNTINFPAYRPSLNISYEVFGESSIGLRFKHFKDFLSYGDLFFDGLIVASNRSISSQTNEPNEYRGQEAGLDFGGVNHQQNLYYTLGLTYRNQLNEQIINNVFDAIGTIDVFNEIENRSESYTLNAFLKFTPLGIIDFQIKALYSRQDRDQLINNTFTTFRTNRLSLEPEFSFAFNKHATTVSAKWDQARIPQIDQTNNQLRLQLAHLWKLASHSSIKLDFSNYYFSSQQESFWTNIVNLTFQYDVPKHKTKLYFSLLNLLNERYFITYLQGAYFDRVATFRLNPIQLQAGFKKSF
jgi:hypothetical protein